MYDNVITLQLLLAYKLYLKCLDKHQVWVPHTTTRENIITTLMLTVLEVQPNGLFTSVLLNFYLWGHLKSLLHSAQIQNEETLHLNISDACQTICNRPENLESLQPTGRHFEHFVVTCDLLHTKNPNVIRLSNKLCQL